MATCPNCGRSFQANHRCRGMWRLRLGFYARIMAGAAITALAGALVVQVMYGGASLAAIALSGAVGAVVMWAFLREPPLTRA